MRWRVGPQTQRGTGQSMRSARWQPAGLLSIATKRGQKQPTWNDTSLRNLRSVSMTSPRAASSYRWLQQRSKVESTENLKDGHKAQQVANGQVYPGCAVLSCLLLPWPAASKYIKIPADQKRWESTDSFETCCWKNAEQYCSALTGLRNSTQYETPIPHAHHQYTY